MRERAVKGIAFAVLVLLAGIPGVRAQGQMAAPSANAAPAVAAAPATNQPAGEARRGGGGRNRGGGPGYLDILVVGR